ncbi:MAG: rubrerythrin family protein, partial [Candidatus Eremiobacteraeota bacterium]|nr:rubrerythrin family protein [Candidatus Eremiobacteraeota bacterium]
MRTEVSKTELNLWTAFMDEAKTHRLYSAYALQAMSEGYPRIAEAFMEAAGDEIVHALMHLRALGAVKSTAENLRHVVAEEGAETDLTYPRYIAEARAEGRADAVEGFELALARERAHVKLFEDALAEAEGSPPASGSAAPQPFAAQPVSAQRIPSERVPRTAVGVAKMSGPAEVTEERERVASLTRIREFVFGAQDGLLTTVSVVSAFFGA